jgi:hypothetical protein
MRYLGEKGVSPPRSPAVDRTNASGGGRRSVVKVKTAWGGGDRGRKRTLSREMQLVKDRLERNKERVRVSPAVGKIKAE